MATYDERMIEYMFSQVTYIRYNQPQKESKHPSTSKKDTKTNTQTYIERIMLDNSSKQ